MAETFETKYYLTYEGLSSYDALIKEYLQTRDEINAGAITDESQRAIAAENALVAALSAYKEEVRVDQAAQNTEIANLKEKDTNILSYLDSQDLAVYNSSGSIANSQIDILFSPAVVPSDASNLQNAIDNSTPNNEIVLTENSIVNNTTVVNKDITIDGKNSTFNNTFTISSNNATILNSNFQKAISI